MIHCLTIDVEDWYHYYPIETWYSFPARVGEPIHWILDQLAKRKIKATFFVLGYIAERHPEIVKEIFQNGHEIGCHGYDHKLVFKKKPKEFDVDIKRALYSIEAAIGFRPNLYRAPAFSITFETKWVWKILYQNGIRRDASLRTSSKKGIHIPEQPFKFRIDQEGFLEEYPLRPIKYFGINISYPGGGYFRITPIKFTIKCAERSKIPFVFYIHPRDIDPGQPKIKKLPFFKKFVTYHDLKGCRIKFVNLLDSLDLSSLGDTYKHYKMQEVHFQI